MQIADDGEAYSFWGKSLSTFFSLFLPPDGSSILLLNETMRIASNLNLKTASRPAALDDKSE
jgi:hypothetical protein